MVFRWFGCERTNVKPFVLFEQERTYRIVCSICKGWARDRPIKPNGMHIPGSRRLGRVVALMFWRPAASIGRSPGPAQVGGPIGAGHVRYIGVVQTPLQSTFPLRMRGRPVGTT